MYYVKVIHFGEGGGLEAKSHDCRAKGDGMARAYLHFGGYKLCLVS